jgi:glycosyltransferase involved in cell wall biosynthesis
VDAVSTHPEVDVIVPVLNGGSRFRDCMRALLDQQDVTFRVIVADNGSDDGSRQVAEAHGVVVVDEPRRSSYAARNAALALGTAPVIAFTDADCVPDPRWLRSGLDAMERAGWDLCAGAIRQVGSRTLAGRYDALTYVRQDINVKRMNFGATGNLFVRREVFEQVGVFDGTVQSGGDLEFGRRATAAGRRIGYCAEAVVSHPARDRIAPLLKKAWRLGGGHAQAGRSDPEVLRWGLSPRRLLPSPFVVRHAWRDPALIGVDLAVKWLTFAARVVMLLRTMRTSRPAAQTTVMVSAWWPTESTPHSHPFVVDHALALQRAVGEVRCWAIVPGLRQRTGRALPIAGDEGPTVVEKTPRVPFRLASTGIGRRVLAAAGWLSGRRRRRQIGRVVLQAFDYAGPYAVGVARGARCPLVYVEHWSAVSRDTLTAGQRASLRYVLGHAEVVLAAGAYLAEALERAGSLPAGSVVPIDNAVDPGVFAATPPVQKGHTVIAQVADFRPVKGHDLLVDAMVSLNGELERLGLRFVLVGDGTERQRIETRLASAGMGSCVEFTGKLSRRQVSDVVRQADWVLLTSESENRPCAVIESLAVGRPVAAPRVGGIPEIVGERDGLLFDRSVEGLSEALRRIGSGSVDALRSWDERAAAAVDRYGADAVARQYRQVLVEDRSA